MRKIILIIVIVLLMGGCGPTSYKEREDSVALTSLTNVNIYTWHDDKLDVTCWYFTGDREGGMSCIPDWMLESPEKECISIAQILYRFYGSPSDSGAYNGWQFYDNNKRIGYENLDLIDLCSFDLTINDHR